jgi:hypothetical protein
MFNRVNSKENTERPASQLQKNKDGIRPFTEHPATNRTEGAVKNTDIKAADLFSIFTADIIKEDVIFTR